MMDKERIIEIKDEYLAKIIYLASDFDGYYDPETKQGSIECLAELIDEVVELAKKALVCDDTSVEYTNLDGKEFNILLEEVNE